MNAQPQEETRRIVSTTLHQINLNNNSCTYISNPSSNSDLENYLTDLLAEISARSQKRAYLFLRETTEFFTALHSFPKQQDLATNERAANLAKRLLSKELDTDNKYGHLNPAGNGHVKRGSFLQFLYRDGALLSYLGVKLEHESFLDEADFRRKIGLSIANKVYKACKVSFNDSGSPDQVFIFDNNTIPAVYWWKDFLELKEVRDDAHNTETACKAVIHVLNTIKKEHPADYTLLRNAAVSAFRQEGEMKYDTFITSVFENYVPEDPDLRPGLQSLISRLRELPNKKKFDTIFKLVPRAVPFRCTKVQLTKEISLTIDDGIQNIEDKIWSTKSISGEKCVVIQSPDGFDKFKYRERF